jgi:TonB family protein
MTQMDQRGSGSRYITPFRRERERVHRRTLLVSVVASILLHALLVPAIAPLREELPLVRHIGYRGERRILPEISIQREPGEAKSEVETMAGDLAKAAFEVIPIEIVDWVVPEEGLTDLTEDDSELTPGDKLLDRLEMSLPQPTSSEVVVSRLVEPDYPAASIAEGVEGVVVFRLHVSFSGEVRRAWLLSSEVDEACELAAYRAVLQWEFEPYLVNGRPSSILVDQRIRFRLTDALRRSSAES